MAAIALLALFGWIVSNPLEASKRFFQVLSFVLGTFNRRYAKAAVEAEANQFLASKLFARVVDAPIPKLKVDWVEDRTDARLRIDGTVIVRLRRERDQSRNVLMTVWAAIGHINFTHARPYLDQRLVTAVDLEVLLLLANMLGPGAQTIFSREMLSPSVAADPEVRDLLPVLHEIQTHGLFEQVLLQEFLYLSEQLRGVPARQGLPDEAQRFVEWLHALATRAPGDERGTLEFIAQHFRVAFILAAKTSTALLGTAPYVRRLGLHLLAGARSVYLMGLTSKQTPLCEEIAEDFDSDRRVTRRKAANLIVERDTGPERVRLVHYLRNDLYMPEGTFAEQLAVHGVVPERRVPADVVNILDNRADLRVGPLDAKLSAADMAWGFRGSPSRFLQPGEKVKVTVLSIDNDRKLIHVGLKQNSPSPWEAGLMPREGEVVMIEVEEAFGNWYIVRLLGVQVPAPPDDRQITLEMFMPESVDGDPLVEVPTRAVYGRIAVDEWSWLPLDSEQYVQPEIGSTHQVEVLVADPKTDDLVLSRQSQEVRGWEGAQKRYPIGTRVRATVVQVLSDGVKLELEPGVFGRVPDYKIQSLGHELQDFQTSIVPGAKYDVVVLGIKQRRKEFRLELARASQKSN